MSVLKLNYIKKFTTGIYDYSMMQSVFTAVDQFDFPTTLKTTMSTQEWCGQVFTQLNLKGNYYKGKSYSYFEQEGDTDLKIEKCMLEDDVWNLVRLGPNLLPVGEVKLIPSLFFTRLKHHELDPVHAIGEKIEDTLSTIYSIHYPSIGRKIAIEFEKQFPHTILGWVETFVENGKQQETSARLKNTLHTDYWNKNKNEFEYLRDSLNLLK